MTAPFTVNRADEIVAEIAELARRNGRKSADAGPCGVESGDNYNLSRTLIGAGLTKREYFASMALQGLIAEYAGDKSVAAAAVQLADALLLELAK